MIRRVFPVMVMAAFLGGSGAPARQLPEGIVAASVGDRVCLVDPATGELRTVETGPVAWLFPGPGGLLFAPDLVHGRTTVVDLRTRGVAQRMDKVTMPRFGAASDRYVVVAGDVLIVGWPDRALLSRIEAEIRHPWQTFISRDSRILVVFERRHSGGVTPTLWLVDLVEHRVVQRVPLEASALNVEMIPSMGLVAVASGEEGVLLRDAATLLPVTQVEVEGRAVDLGWSGAERLLLVGVAHGEAGSVRRLELRTKKDRLRVKERPALELPAPVVHLALSPEGSWAGVAAASGEVTVFHVASGERVSSARLSGEPRDLVWCDPGRPGPLLPQWSVTPGGEIRTQPTPAFGGTGR